MSDDEKRKPVEVSEDGTLTYEADDGSKWDMFVGDGEDMQAVLDMIDAEKKPDDR